MNGQILYEGRRYGERDKHTQREGKAIQEEKKESSKYKEYMDL